MRILHVAAPAKSGGLERVVELLCLGQHRRGHQACLAAVLEESAEVPPFIDRLTHAGVHVSQLRIGGRDYAGERRALRDLLARSPVDVLHTHGYRADVLDSGLADGGTASVSTVHGFTGAGFRGRFYEFLQVRSYRRLHAVVAVSAPIQERLLRAGVAPGRIQLIRNSYRFSAAPVGREEARRILAIPEHQYTVGWIGRLSHEKGPDVMLRAAFELAADRVAVSFVGGGKMENELSESLRNSSTGSLVTFHGPVDDAGALVRAFDVLALSSRTEGTPMVLLEAILAGVPVIATRVGGVPDVVSDSEAVLVDSEDASAISRAVNKLRKSPEVAKAVAAAALQRISHEFDYDRWLDAYDAVYAAAISRASL